MNMVREFRQNLGITQEELSFRSGIPCDTIAKIESGQEVTCKTRDVLALSETLGHSIEEIFLL